MGIQNNSKTITIQSAFEIYNAFSSCHPDCFFGSDFLQINEEKKFSTVIGLESSHASKFWPKLTRKQAKQEGQDEEEHLIETHVSSTAFWLGGFGTV